MTRFLLSTAVLAAIACPEAIAQNVGIGTETPLVRLHLSGGASNLLRIESSSTQNWVGMHTTNGYIGYFGVFSGANDMDFGTGSGNSTGKVQLVTNAIPRLTVSSAGNVGVGITVPTQRLEVNGKLKVGNDAAAPAAGTIRFNTATNDFEGYDGTQWKSLTKPAFSKLIYQSIFRDRSVPSATGYSAMGDFSADNNLTLLVGNRLGHINAAIPKGSVEVYLRSPSTGIYTYRTRFQDPDAADFSSFGSSIVFTSNLNTVISNPTQPGPNGLYDGGRISLFLRDNSLNTYNYQTGINGANGARLGHAMSTVGDTLLVSLPGANACRLYTLGTNTFNLRFSFNRPAGDNGTYGDAVAVGDGGNVLAIASTQTATAGRVYIIRRSGAFMNASGTLTAPNSETQFGKALLFTNNEIVVGGGGNRVYVYNNNIGLNLRQTLQPDYNTPNSDFGASLAYHPADDALYVGAPLDNSVGGGMIYKYNKNAAGNFELTERIYDFGGTQVGSKLTTEPTGTLLSRALRCGSTTIASF